MTLALTDRVAELLPRAALLQLVSAIEEQKRRARAGRRVPEALRVVLALDRETGEVQENLDISETRRMIR